MGPTKIDHLLDGTLLVAAAGRAHLRADAEFEHHLGEGRVVALDLAATPAPLHDRARAIEDRHQRHAAEGDEVTDQGAHQCLDALVVDEGHGDEARVLPPRREEVDALAPPIDGEDVDLAEVVLRELTGKPFEANHGPGCPRRTASATSS